MNIAQKYVDDDLRWIYLQHQFDIRTIVNFSYKFYEIFYAEKQDLTGMFKTGKTVITHDITWQFLFDTLEIKPEVLQEYAKTRNIDIIAPKSYTSSIQFTDKEQAEKFISIIMVCMYKSNYQKRRDKYVNYIRREQSRKGNQRGAQARYFSFTR